MQVMAAANYYEAILDQFDRLPGAAIIPDLVAAKILGMSVWTLRRNNPVPQYRLSPRCRGRRVDDIRALRGTGPPAGNSS
jgi:hypothetical protein